MTREEKSTKAIGIVRKIDELGRIVLPVELRRTMEIGEGTPMEIFVDGNNIVLRKYAKRCALCGEENERELIETEGICICRACAITLSAKARQSGGKVVD